MESSQIKQEGTQDVQSLRSHIYINSQIIFKKNSINPQFNPKTQNHTGRIPHAPCPATQFCRRGRRQGIEQWASTPDKSPQFYNRQNTDMYRLVLSKLARPAFSSARLSSRNIQEFETAILPNQLQREFALEEATSHKQVLTAAHSGLQLNFLTEENGKTPLLVSLDTQEDTSILKRALAPTLGLVSLAQIYLGIFNYYCVIGTVGIAALLHFSVSSPAQQLYRSPCVGQIYGLKDGSVQIQFSNGKQKTLVVPKQKFAFGDGKAQNFNSSTASCVIDGKLYRLPVNRLVNNVKLGEFLH